MNKIIFTMPFIGSETTLPLCYKRCLSLQRYHSNDTSLVGLFHSAIYSKGFYLKNG